MTRTIASATIVLLMLGLLVAGCGSVASTPSPSAPGIAGTQSVGTGSSTPPADARIAEASLPALSATQPRIVLGPNHGSAGTVVRVSGEGFPPFTEVQVRLAGLSSGATDDSYASATTSKEGTLYLDFVVPSHWPNGDQILLPRITVMASTTDFVYKATELFTLDGTR